MLAKHVQNLQKHNTSLRAGINRMNERLLYPQIHSFAMICAIQGIPTTHACFGPRSQLWPFKRCVQLDSIRSLYSCTVGRGPSTIIYVYTMEAVGQNLTSIPDTACYVKMYSMYINIIIYIIIYICIYMVSTWTVITIAWGSTAIHVLPCPA